MYNATISADIIASSSLDGEEIDHLTQRISWLFEQINENQRKWEKEIIFSRLVSGDLIECLIINPCDALKIALIIKSGIKSFPLYSDYEKSSLNKYRKLFQTYGVRIAIGIGQMNMNLLDKNILNGDAINRSGRLIAEQKTSNKERVVIKNTFFFDSPVKAQTDLFSLIMSLLDEILNKTTAKQSNIILFKLLGYSEAEIAQELGIKQSTVNQQSKAAGWNSIEQAVRYYSCFDFTNTVIHS